MTLNSDPFELTERDLGTYGYARTRDIAFDAVCRLWDLRRRQGMKQATLASKIGRDPGWVSRNLRGPGNWTLRTLGEFVVGLGGRLKIEIIAEESASELADNFHAYHDFERPPQTSSRVKTIWEDPDLGRPKSADAPTNSAKWVLT
jgi:transcriptional regulator with XRE-family HTH domain